MSKNAPINTRVTVENINVPGYKSTVDGIMYQAMYQALMKALPIRSPGIISSRNDIRGGAIFTC